MNKITTIIILIFTLLPSSFCCAKEDSLGEKCMSNVCLGNKHAQDVDRRLFDPLVEAEFSIEKIDLFVSLKKRIKTHVSKELNESFDPLSYDEFVKLREEKRITDEQAEELIDYAYKIGDPILFRKAKEKIAPEIYSLNLMWIHKQALMGAGHLMGDDDNSLQKNVISPIIDWHIKQPQANINFWYDGNMLENENLIIKNTKDILVNNQYVNIDRIRFRNIREVDVVKENQNIFEEKVDVFFRVDLAKAVIADYVMRNDGVSYSVTMDSDVLAITNEQLFDQQTLENLEAVGFEFNSYNMNTDDNSFFIIYGGDDYILDLHRKWIIDISIESAAYGRTYDQAVFYHYDYSFKKAALLKHREVNNDEWWCYVPKRKKENECLVVGKAVISPKSQHAIFGGFEPNKIEALRPHLFGGHYNTQVRSN